MTVDDIASSVGASLINSAFGQTERARSSARSDDAVGQAFDAARQRTEQQRNSTQVSLSSFGQLRSSVDQLQNSSAALTNGENTGTPEEATQAAQNFVDAFNNAQTTARSVTNGDSGALANNGRAAVAASQIARALDDNSREQLRRIGINRNQDGTLSIDRQRFQQTLQNTPEQVGGSLASVGRQVQDATSRQLDSNSQINRAVSTLNTRAEALASQQTQLQQAAQQATRPERTQEDQAAGQQQAQQAQQQATDTFNGVNAIAASGIAAYQKILAL